MSPVVLLAFLSGLFNEPFGTVFTEKKLVAIDTIPSKEIYADKSVRKIESGFYLLTADTTNSKGMKIVDKDEYYFLDSVPVIPIIYVDSISKNYIKSIDRFELTIKFNHTGTRIWDQFTWKNSGRTVGLVIDNQLLNAVRIQGHIPNGLSSLMLPYSEKQIDDLKNTIDNEINKIKEESKKRYR